MADIANASTEQATGIEQINKAMTQMDEVAQQNSALVEENAATAKTLEHQAKAMDEQVAFFQIGGSNELLKVARSGNAPAKPTFKQAGLGKGRIGCESFDRHEQLGCIEGFRNDQIGRTGVDQPCRAAAHWGCDRADADCARRGRQ